MINELIAYMKDKKVLIIGFGTEGKSNYNFLRRYFPNKKITVMYHISNEKEQKEYLEKDEKLNFLVGENYLKGLEEFDLIIKSPGISLKGIDISPFVEKITSQLELFLEYMECYTIGITGTKGKSTTSSLIYQMLLEQGKKATLLGNIGIPIFDEIEKIHKDTIVVLEMSSHGLEYVKKSPNIGILLNIYEEHLDHYNSITDYIKAKYNIFRYQKQQDIAIFNLDNKLMKQYHYDYLKKDYGITLEENQKSLTDNTIYRQQNKIYYNQIELYDTNEERQLKGIHMLHNIMFVFAVSIVLQLDLNKTRNTINNFEPLEHRREFVGTYSGIQYYNDSIATIPEATIDGIESLQTVNTVIVGGKDRGINLNELIEYLNHCNVQNIICLPKTGEYIYEGIDKKKKRAIQVDTLEEAVKYAKRYTEKGKICLLSPAASSYGYFKDFKERGNIYKQLVRQENK